MVTRVNGLLCSPLIDAAEDFRSVLTAARTAIAPAHFEWYPYDSLGNMVHLTKLLEHTGIDLMKEVHGRTILDLGCADGDIAFFLESLGASVVAVDHPRSNHNNLAGVAALRDHFASPLDIRRLDLDAGIYLDGSEFELTLALGLLYHLKNPILFLESLAKCTHRCILSTRVMKQLPNLSRDVSGTPVAYLLGADELNGDNSNYWIFTESGLKRLFERSHWKLLAWTTVGDVKASTPHTLDRDERAFCLLESRWGRMDVDLGDGWYGPEDSGWRWTARRFSASAKGSGNARFVVASIYVPEALLSETAEVGIALRVNGSAAETVRVSRPGLFRYRTKLPVTASDLSFEWEVSRDIPPALSDGRELALIFESLGLE